MKTHESTKHEGMDYAPPERRGYPLPLSPNQEWGIQIKELLYFHSILSGNTNTALESKDVKKNHRINNCYMKLKNFE